MITNINTSVFKVINGFAYKIPIIDKIMILLSKYIPAVFIIVLASFYIYGICKKAEKVRYDSVNTFVLTVINLFLSYIVGFVYFEPRPFVSNRVNLLFYHTADASFPSDHAIGTMSIALGINNNSKIIGRVLTCLSILVGISRIYVGHHYPLDVIGSYIIVIITNYLYNHLLKKETEKIYARCEKFIAKLIPVVIKLNDK